MNVSPAINTFLDKYQHNTLTIGKKASAARHRGLYPTVSLLDRLYSLQGRWVTVLLIAICPTAGWLGRAALVWNHDTYYVRREGLHTFVLGRESSVLERTNLFCEQDWSTILRRKLDSKLSQFRGKVANKPSHSTANSNNMIDEFEEVCVVWQKCKKTWSTKRLNWSLGGGL